ncbi:MAG: hypothetical protein M3450_12570 [Actinomycetota bacterium]|nr:hypothetical protein [Actinomycetota bacterium]
MNQTRGSLQAATERKEFTEADTAIKGDLTALVSQAKPQLWLDMTQIAKEMADLGRARPKLTRDEAGGGTDTTARDELLAQLNTDLLTRLRLQDSQMGAFKSFAPLVGQRLLGAFAHGGPMAPLMRTFETSGLAMVHRDETVIPDPQGPYGSTVHTSSGPTEINVYIEGDAALLMGRVRAEIDGRAAQVVRRDLGRSARLILNAPGGR